MTIQSVDGKNPGEKSAFDRGRNMGDPAEDDQRADEVNDRRAGRPHRDSKGKGVTPIEGTSASNLEIKPGQQTCGNPYTGYGLCGGVVDDVKGHCTKCFMPTKRLIEEAMPMLHTDMGTPNGGITQVSDSGGAVVEVRLPAHEKEAARHIIRRSVSADAFEMNQWDPDAMGQYSTVPPHLRKKWLEIQKEIDAECQRRFRTSGLEPRRHD